LAPNCYTFIRYFTIRYDTLPHYCTTTLLYDFAVCSCGILVARRDVSWLEVAPTYYTIILLNYDMLIHDYTASPMAGQLVESGAIPL
jgi:hypothetical protein